jgi:hypothetical protein
MHIDPIDQKVIDHVFETKSHNSNVRSWVIWLAIFALSMCALYLFNHDYVTGWFGNTLGLLGIFGVIGFIFFLSTKSFGQVNTSLWWR